MIPSEINLLLISSTFALLFVSLILSCIYVLRITSFNVTCVLPDISFIFEDLWPQRHLVHRLTDLYHRHREQHAVYGFYICFSKCLLINDLTIAQNILTENFSNFKNRGMYSNERSDPLSAILGSVDHSEWKRLRATMSNAFTPAKIKHMFRFMRDTGDKMILELQEITANDNSVEIRDFFSRFATDVIVEAAIGIDFDSDAGTKVRQMLSKSLGLKFKYTRVAIAHPTISRWLDITKHPANINKIFIDFVVQTINYRRENPGDRTDYLQILIDADLTMNQIAALTHDFLSAGYSDSTSTLAYCLYELSLPENKHIQDDARKEIQSVFEQHNGELTYEMVHKMLCCKKIIDETLRKHPPGGYLMRVATESYKVPNTAVTIPKGMRVFIPVFAIHHDEKYHPDPDVFNPERDLTCGRTYMPFGRGPRQCIGFRFATLLVCTGLVLLLRNFEFSTCDRTPMPMEYSSEKNTLVPNAGVWLKVSKL